MGGNSVRIREVRPVQTQPSEPAFRSYDSYIAGNDVPGVGWVYTVTARALLEDVFTAVKLKRTLEQDPHSDARNHPYVVGRCAVAGTDQIDSSIEAAAAATPVWAAAPLAARLRLGELFRERLIGHREEFLDVLVAEAHPRKLAEWEFSCLMQVFSPESCSWYADQMYTEFEHGPRRLIVRRQADGVVCFNPPQNAPAPSAALSVLALMAGNAVVVRAPRSIPLSTMYVLRELVVPLLQQLEAPPGVLNIICGQPKQILDRWIEHPDVNDIFYIGGSEEGLSLQERCVANGKKPILELAGNDGLVVWHDANLELAAEAITECFFGSGQICMVPKYVIAHPAIAHQLIVEVVAQIARIKPGYPDDPDVLLSPVRRSEKFFAQLHQAIAQGAHLITGGRRVEVDGSPSDTGVFLEPTVLRVDGMVGARELDVVAHETFYPMVPIVVAEPGPDDVLLDLMIEFINANSYGLRNSLWTGSDEVVDHFVRNVGNAGLLKVNDSHIGFLPYLPTHGGTGLTGGAFGEANYPILKTSHLQGVSIARGVRPRDAVFG
ncbi:aldehyde dehydrogenase family protein [Jatrophihabitans lederbergiae]|uniref:Aldehyde dehydrogenase family protein n=1 Tax=Jatrophihabitans lederbergiae TaxID=3075547 RepID=A0ABU2JAW6_9ACTN|nr:aldehyde dehydrogenase family protein [Jatrophihabitans sp. DSM 44399]MDT0262141.1 aldehyde dehydrogenase family protein [Jatrophihabitans sp. DSM 44399]